jgi:hypothetical protein
LSEVKIDSMISYAKFSMGGDVLFALEWLGPVHGHPMD